MDLVDESEINYESFPTESAGPSGGFEYDDEDSMASDFDENLADHANVVLTYFNHMYKTEKSIDLSLHWAGNNVAKGHRLVVAAFCRKLDPVICGNSACPHIKVDMRHLGIEPEDLRAVFDFLYSGRISIRGPGVLRALQELGCFHILPLLDEVWQEGCPMITVEDKYHAINFLNRLREFKENRNYIDFSFRIQNFNGIECHRWVVAAYCPSIEQSLRPVESPIVYMEVDSSPETVREVVDYIYSGSISPGIVDFTRLKELALSFGMHRLTNYFNEEFSFFTPTEEELEYRGNLPEREDLFPVRIEPQSPAANPRNRNLASESDYVGIYNEYVQGPKMAAYRLDDDEDSRGTADSRTSRYTYRFKCPSCPYMGCDRTTIKKHIRSIHTQETPYTCEICGAAFKIQSNMARHMRTHSKVKPYKCKECGSSYADKKNMDAHVFKTHLKREPFKCPHNCPNAKFYREDSWIKHFEKKHKNQAVMTPFVLRPIVE